MVVDGIDAVEWSLKPSMRWTSSAVQEPSELKSCRVKKEPGSKLSMWCSSFMWIVWDIVSGV